MNSEEELIQTLVPIIRTILKKGLSQNFLKSCVRIGEVNPINGGLKSNFVGHIRIDVNTVVKTHSEELKLHKILMEKVNDNKNSVKVFPEIVQLIELNKDLYIMLMEELLKFETFLELIYSKNLKYNELEKLIFKTMERISIIHRTKIEENINFPVNTNPYNKRIKEKINQILKLDKDLDKTKNLNGIINNKDVLPISELLTKLQSWLKTDLVNLDPRLVHGDYHLGNILFRPRGRGFSCLTIDPNPLIGISDPIYDFGKLLHWIDIVGWAKYKPEYCKSDWSSTKNKWELNYRLNNEPRSVKHRRETTDKILKKHLEHYSVKFCGDWEKRLNISLASAHLGLAVIFDKPENADVRRFIFARAIELLNDVITN